MGKRSAVVELFKHNMGSIQRETRPSIQREDQLTMKTKLEQIAVKARCEPKLRFTSLAHHITRDRVQENLLQIPKHSAVGVDGQTRAELAILNSAKGATLFCPTGLILSPSDEVSPLGRFPQNSFA
jgi:hypothetical protein